MPAPRAPYRPDDCLECPNSIDERKLGIDDGLACDLPDGPRKVMGQEGYDGRDFFPPPAECPLWLARRRDKDAEAARADEVRDRKRDDATLSELSERADGYMGR